MATRYNLAAYDSEEEREKDPAGPPLANMFAAADFIGSLFTMNNIHVAFMGGFAMICYGSRRNTWDIDIITNASMRHIWAIIEPQPRLIIPDTKLLDGVVRIFVRTGPTNSDVACDIDRSIEVDLVLPGAKGTPRNVVEHRQLIQVNTTGGARTYYSLDHQYLMITKLRHCVTRTMTRDIQDIRFLLDSASQQIRAVRNAFNRDEIEFFLNTNPIKAAEKAIQSRYRNILLE